MTQRYPHLKTLMIALAVSGSLSGCLTAAIGGAAVGAASVADRRTTGAQADDEVMEVRIKQTALNAIKYNGTAGGFSPELSVVSYNRHILLLGYAASEADKQLAERVARSEKSAQQVYNYIQVVPAAQRTIGAISSDSWVTSKVRTNLLTTSGVYPGHVKVVTYAGTAYVMGILTPEQQANINERVRTTTGVQQVVTLYETITR